MPIPGFYGRRDELAWLRGEFEACAKRNGDGKFAGPRMAFVVAESGIGKSRLVQALYQQLTDDPRWDPPDVGYWPQSFNDQGKQLRVTPDMKGHIAKGPPRFAWLGARWESTAVRNVTERKTALPELRDSIMVHAEILRQYGSAWQDATGRIGKELKKDGLVEGVSQIADYYGIPFVGLLFKLGKGTMDLYSQRMEGPRSFDAVQQDAAKTSVEEVYDCMRALLDGDGGLPTVLWLDDAQWIDAETQDFVRKVWQMATKRRWPLLIVITHWEGEWLQLKRAADASTLCAFEGVDGVSMRVLASADTQSLSTYLAQGLPGLTPVQQQLLLEKAAGNFLTMVENVGQLLCTPSNFIGGDVKAALAPVGEKIVRDWESDRQRRVEQRFNDLDEEVRKLLGWGSHLGIRFLSEVVERMAEDQVVKLSIGRASRHLSECVDPLAILGRSSELLREFRDKAFHTVSLKYFKDYSQEGESQVLAEILRACLSEWINNSFNDQGEEIWPNSEQDIQAPPRSATGLESAELRDLLGMACRELPLPQPENWSDPSSMAALRARYMLIITDSREDLWDRVRTSTNTLQSVAWADVPEEVLSSGNVGGLADVAEISGAYRCALGMYETLLQRVRKGGRELNTPESRGFVIVLLLRIGALECMRGEHESALAKFRECLEIARALSEELNTPESRRDVSLSLGHIGEIELMRGDIESALAKFQESLEIARILSEEFNTLENRRDVSVLLDWIGDIERMRGEHESALAKFQECLAIARALSEELDTPEIRRDVSVSLNRIGNIERMRGEHESAVAKFQECLEIARALSEELNTPGSRRDVSFALDRIGDIECMRGEHESALAKFQESLEIRRALSEELSTPPSRRDVSFSLDRIGDIECMRGEHESALAKFQESLEIRRALSEELNTPEIRREVSVSLTSIGGIELMRGEHESALAKFQESLEIRRALSEELNTPESRGDVGSSLDRIGNIERMRGEHESALAKFQESLEIRRALSEELNTPGSRRDVTVSLELIGDIELMRGEHESALAKFQECLEIARALSEELNTPQSRRDVSVSLLRIGDIELMRGELGSAVAKFRECLEIARALSEELNTPQIRGDMSVSLERIGDIELMCGEHESALAKFQECLEIRRASSEELNTPESRRGVIVSLLRIGDIECMRSEHESALAKFRENLEIARALSEELNTPESRQDVSLSLVRIGDIECMRSEHESALAKFRECLEIARALATQSKLVHDANQFIWLLLKCSGCLHAIGRSTDALGLLLPQESTVLRLEAQCNGSPSELDRVAEYFEALSEIAGVVGRADIAAEASGKAKAIRARIA